METNTELVKIDPAQYGLQATEASQVEAVFLPMIAKMKELETEFNEVINMPLEPSTFAKAKELRLKYVKVRTGTAEIHKTAKAYYLNGGRFVDGWKNAQSFASQEKEQTLEKIEKHFEILEAERKAKLKAERLEKITGLTETPEMYPLSEMSDATFEQLLNGFILAKKQKEEAEAEAEKQRLEAIRLEAERVEKIRLENERLQKEADKQEKIQAELNAKLEDERKERERIEKELRAKQEAEIIAKEKAELEAKAKQLAEKKAANAPDKNKLISFAKFISEIQLPEVKSSESEKILFDAKTLLNKVSAFVTDKAKEL